MSIKSFRMIFLAVAVFFVHPAWAMDDALLAVVNDEAITVKDLQDYLNGIYAQLRIEGRTAAESQEIMAEYQKRASTNLSRIGWFSLQPTNLVFRSGPRPLTSGWMRSRRSTRRMRIFLLL